MNSFQAFLLLLLVGTVSMGMFLNFISKASFRPNDVIKLLSWSNVSFLIKIHLVVPTYIEPLYKEQRVLCNWKNNEIWKNCLLHNKITNSAMKIKFLWYCPIKYTGPLRKLKQLNWFSILRKEFYKRHTLMWI